MSSKSWIIERIDRNQSKAQPQEFSNRKFPLTSWAFVDR